MPRALSLLALACVLASCALAGVACSPGELDRDEIRRLQAENRAEETIEPLREALLEDPNDREASFLLGAALAQANRYGEAMFHLRRAALDGAFAQDAGMLLSATALLIENYEASIEAAEAVIARNPDAVTAWLLRGQAALVSARPEIALESARRVRELQPDDFASRVIEAGALTALDRNDDAEQALAGLLEAAPKVGPEAVATACTEYARFQVTLGEDPGAARATLDSCSDVLIRNELWVDAGARIYVRAGDAAAGEALIERALDAQPANHSMRMLLADGLARIGKTSEAEAVLRAGTEQPHATRIWVALSNLERAEGDLAGALEAIDRALETGEGDAEAYRFVHADLLVDLGRLDEAREAADSLTEPIYRDIVHGRIALERDDPKRALALFGSVLQQWPDHAGVRVLAARAAHELGDEDRALTELVEATRAAPRDTDAALLLARLHLLRGDGETAYAYARRHLDHRGTGQAEGLLVGAAAARAIGDDKGVRALLEALKERPEHAALGVSELASYVAGAEGLAAGRRVIEESGLELAAPENGAALRRLVRLELDAGDTDAALRTVDAVLKESPDNLSARAVRAHVLLTRGAVDAAKTEFETALAVDPDHAESIAGLAQVALGQGDLSVATSGYLRAAELQPEEPAYRYGLAQARLAAGDTEAAEAQLNAVLRSHPEHAAAANDLAWLLALRGEALPRALLLAERAVRNAPSPETRDTLGLVYLRLDRTAEAREAFETALLEKPEYSSARFHLALAHLEQGDRDAARDALRRALAGEAFSEAAEARALLDRLGS